MKKEVKVLDKSGGSLSCCTRKRAKQLTRRRSAMWVGIDTIQLVLNKEDKVRIDNYVKQRDNYTCYICGKVMQEDDPRCTVDHVISRSRGGTDFPDNKACCCKDCNSSKGSLTLQEYIDLRKSQGKTVLSTVYKYL